VLGLAACGGQAGGEPDTNQQENSTTPVSDESTPPENSSTSAAPETITITSLNGNREPAELEVPYDPQRIAILDMASLDILDALGVGDRVVGSASTSLDYLQSYVTDNDVANLGTIKEADLEAVMACEPDVIFIGGRLSKSYDALSEIAPVVYLATDSSLGVVESVRKNLFSIYLTVPECAIIVEEEGAERDEKKLSERHQPGTI
jgi:iron complex transport system substrate-binding protein